MTLDQGLWTTTSGEETEKLGGQLLGKAPARGAPCRIITLSGDLGAGKSTFARGALRALGVTGPIKSPSYTLLETYSLAAVTVVRFPATTSSTSNSPLRKNSAVPAARPASLSNCSQRVTRPASSVP